MKSPDKPAARSAPSLLTLVVVCFRLLTERETAPKSRRTARHGFFFHVF